MHAFRPAATGTPKRLIAGDRISIHHNTMLANGPALGVRIRGVPRDLAEIHDNWFSEEDPALAVEQLEPHGNVWVYNNVCGPTKQLVAVAMQCTPRILFREPPPPTEAPVKVRGNLALDIDVSVLHGLELRSVIVQLDEKKLYSGSGSPGPGEVAIDTTVLENGAHELSVMATDNRDVTAQQSVTLQVEN
jgi:hypothetical protein